MRELKDYDIMDIEAMDDERLEKSESGIIKATRVYIKDEVDKVIAELKAQVNGFFNRANLWHYNAQNEHNAAVAVRMENAKLKAKIAEKDKEIQRLENLCESYRIDCDNLAIREANAYKEIERDNKRSRHQKHKRCFAMAKWCEEQYKYLTCLENWQMTDKEYQQVIGDYWDRWHKHWLKIAEQFKDKETK